MIRRPQNLCILHIPADAAGIHSKNMRDKIKILTLALLLLCTTRLFSQEGSADRPKWVELHGYIKDMQIVSFGGTADSLSSSNLVYNRLNLKFNLSKKLSARFEIRNRMFYGDQVAAIPDFGNLINQYPGNSNLSVLWVNQPNLVIQSVVDRMLVQYSTIKWDVTVGRQRINWGINNIWNPNDIFNAYNFLDFDYEERPGNDAIRVQHYLKDNSTIEFAYKPADADNQSIGAVLYKFNRKKYDIQFLAGVFNTDIVVGAGWAGSIHELGFKGEISYFHPKKQFTDSTGVISASVMADYTFKNNWYVNLSFLFNSDPSNSFNLNYKYMNFNVTAKNLFPFRYTLYTGVVKSFSPITSLNMAMVYSPTNNTLLLYPTFSWNIAEDFDMDFIIQSFFASQEGHYQSLGSSVFLRFRWSF